MKALEFFSASFVIAGVLCGVSKFYDYHVYMNSRSSNIESVSIDESYIVKKMERAVKNKRLLSINECKKSSDCKKIAEAIYFEARGESDIGKISVAQVIIQRKKMANFPNTIHGVIHQKNKDGICHFSYICQLETGFIRNKFSDTASYNKSLELAYGVIHNQYKNYVKNADHYYNPDKVEKTPTWASSMKKVAKIGNHLYLSSKNSDTIRL